MNIVVLVKQVPDSGTQRSLDPSDNTVARAAADNVINEIDEYAIEEALQVKAAQGGEVTILTVGPASATDAIRKALSMGADRAVHVVDDAIHGSCAIQTSGVLAAALQQMEYDLAPTGAPSNARPAAGTPALRPPPRPPPAPPACSPPRCGRWSTTSSSPAPPRPTARSRSCRRC